MKHIGKLNSHLLILAITALLFSAVILILNLSLTHHQKGIYTAITIDLLLTIPVIYFLMIRKSSIPKTTVLPIIIIGLVIGSIFLPKDQQTVLGYFKTWILPLVELFVLFHIGIKIRKGVQSYNSKKGQFPDFMVTTKEVCSEILPKKVSNIFVTEIAMIYYGLFKWKKQKARTTVFSYHKESSSIAILSALLIMIVAETFALHLLIAKWSHSAAWLLTILSVYTFFQVFGLIKSIIHRPITITQNGVFLKYGLMNDVLISFNEILSIQHSDSEMDEIASVSIHLSPIGQLEGHNIILKLKEEKYLSGFYGIRKKFKTISFFIDQPKLFIETISEKIE